MLNTWHLSMNTLEYIKAFSGNLLQFTLYLDSVQLSFGKIVQYFHQDQYEKGFIGQISKYWLTFPRVNAILTMSEHRQILFLEVFPEKIQGAKAMNAAVLQQAVYNTLS